MENSKEKIIEKIKKLQNELKDIEEIEKHKVDINKIQVGDYLLYDKDYWKIAQVCLNEDNVYQMYYPQNKEVSYYTAPTIKELYDSWIDIDELVIHIPVKNDRINYLEIDKEYFIFDDNGSSSNWKIIRLDIEEEPIIAYDIETELIIEQGKDVDELLAILLSQYNYIVEIRNDNLEEKYTLLNDEEFLKDLTYSILDYYKDIYGYDYVGFDNYQLIDAGENIVRYSGLSKEELLNIVNKEIDLDEYKSNKVILTLNSFIEGTKDYFLDSISGKWFPINLGLFFDDYFPDTTDKHGEYTYQLTNIKGKYALYNIKTKELYPKLYSTVKDIADDIYHKCYEEIIIEYSSFY